jgi:hypothetical protein
MRVNVEVEKPSGEPGVPWAYVLDAQDGVVTHAQARQYFSERQIEHRLAPSSSKWQRMHRGVYATFTGKPSREARLWAAVLWAGGGAMLSHQTAAELQELTDKQEWMIHVTIPSARRARGNPMRGVIVHRSDQSRGVAVGEWKLPRTVPADTVLDLAGASPTIEDAYGWVSGAVTRGKVSVGELREALDRRKRFSGRAWLTDALADCADGVDSPLELRYVRDVERAHGLPKSVRQARRVIAGEAHRKDISYEGYLTCVEMDGLTYHQDKQHADRHRDNVNLAVDDIRTFRFDITDVTGIATCRSAALVATTLRRQGWTGNPHKCRKPDCTFDTVL